MTHKKPPVVGREIRARLDQLHALFGGDQSLPDILDGLIIRLGQARVLYGPGRSLPEAVSGIYYLLDAMRKLYGSDSVEEILSGIIDRKKRLNRLVELQSKDAVTFEERHEIQFLERVHSRYVHHLVKQRRARRDEARALNGKAHKRLVAQVTSALPADAVIRE